MMKKRFFIYISFLSPMLFSPAWAQDNHNFQADLRSSIHWALTETPTAKSIEAEENVARADVWENYAAFLPTVRGSLGFSNTEADSSLPRAVKKSKDERSLSLQVEVPIFRSGQLVNGLMASRSRAKSAYWEAQLKRNQIIQNVIRLTVELDYFKSSEDLLSKQIRYINRTLQALKARNTVGISSDRDINLVEAELLQYESRIKQIQSRISATQVELKSLTAQTEIAPFPWNKVLDSIDLNPDALIEYAHTHSPALLKSQADTKASEHTAKAVVGEYLPQVSLWGRYDSELKDISLDSVDGDWAVGARVSMPLLDLSSVGRISKARYRSQALYYASEDQKRQLEVLVRSQSVELRNQQQQIAKGQKAAELLLEVAKGQDMQLLKGFSSLENVLDAYQDYAETELALLQLRAQHHSAISELLLTIGMADVTHVATLQ